MYIVYGNEEIITMMMSAVEIKMGTNNCLRILNMCANYGKISEKRKKTIASYIVHSHSTYIVITFRIFCTYKCSNKFGSVQNSIYIRMMEGKHNDLFLHSQNGVYSC